MSVTEDLSQYAGQRVIVTVNLDEPNAKGETCVEVEGTAEAANAAGIMFKPKGRTSVEIIEIAKIERVQFAPEKPKDLKAKPLQLVKYGTARAHLLERHGYKISSVNALTEEQALRTHGEIEHEAQELGHLHQEKTETPRVEAIAEPPGTAEAVQVPESEPAF